MKMGRPGCVFYKPKPSASKPLQHHYRYIFTGLRRNIVFLIKIHDKFFSQTKRGKNCCKYKSPNVEWNSPINQGRGSISKDGGTFHHLQIAVLWEGTRGRWCSLPFKKGNWKVSMATGAKFGCNLALKS